MTAAAAELRRQVLAAVMAEAGQGRAPDRAAIARRFRGQAPETTLARWIKAAIDKASSGTPPPESVVVNTLTPSVSSSMSERSGDVAPEPGCGGHVVTAVSVDFGDLLRGWSDAELRRLDQWRQFQIDQPSRAEAVRRLALAALRPGA